MKKLITATEAKKLVAGSEERKQERTIVTGKPIGMMKILAKIILSQITKMRAM